MVEILPLSEQRGAPGPYYGALGNDPLIPVQRDRRSRQNPAKRSGSPLLFLLHPDCADFIAISANAVFLDRTRFT